MRNKVAKPLRKLVTQRCGGSIPKYVSGRGRNPLRHMKKVWNRTPRPERRAVMLKMMEEIL